uniref:PAP-specific phosphatase family protein n=1 Tax=Rhizophora mucronata TaxID=61149 RepID=A0A2P2JXG0_RHIMU
MGCPNWQEIVSDNSNDVKGPEYVLSRGGMIMVAHIGCGTWIKRLFNMLGISAEVPSSWTRCFVDECCLVPEARYCIPDSQTWDSFPLSALFSASNDPFAVGDTEILLLPTCCGSLCKYMMVASGRASVFLLQARSQTIIKV